MPKVKKPPRKPALASSVRYTRLAHQIMQQNNWKYPVHLQQLRDEMNRRRKEWE